MSQPASVLLCRCIHANPVAADVCEQARQRLSAVGLAVDVVDDLCGLAARRDQRVLELIRAAGDSLAIVACFPRTIRWLFDWAGAPLAEGARLFNLRTQSLDEVVATLTTAADGLPVSCDARTCGPAAKQDDRVEPESRISDSEFRIPNSEIPADWVPWFPVVDYDRCKNCRKCANFCLFAVYSVEDGGRVRVAQPSKCKTNCPACARLCPHAAIIFPKYQASPINGDEVTAANSAAEQVGAEFAIPAGVDGNLLDALRKQAIQITGQNQDTHLAAGLARREDPKEQNDSTSRDVPAGVQQILDAMKKRPAGK